MLLLCVERDEFLTIHNNLRIFKILLVDWSANFAMDNECKKSRMKEATNEFTSLISSLSLGSEEMPIVNMCNWLEKKLLMESTTWLVDLL